MELIDLGAGHVISLAISRVVGLMIMLEMAVVIEIVVEHYPDRF